MSMKTIEKLVDTRPEDISKRACQPKPRLHRITWYDFRDTDYYYNLEEYLKGYVDILDLMNNPKVHPWEKLWAFTREGIVRKETRELWRKKVIEKFGEFVPISNRRVLHTVEYYLQQEQEVELAIEAINETYNTEKDENQKRMDRYVTGRYSGKSV